MAGLLTAATLVLGFAGAAGAELRVEYVPPSPDAPAAVRLEGLAPAVVAGLEQRVPALENAAAVSVRLLPIDGAELPSVLGRTRVEAGGLVFEPRFPLGAGLTFEVRVDGATLDALAGAAAGTTPPFLGTLSIAPSLAPTARVSAFYPSTHLVPENLLRLYIHFSAPMRRRDVVGSVHLESTDGERANTPFVEIPDGLWDRAGRRLTLFLHPGRIKRGVGPRAVLGPVLEAGERYRLVVDAGMLDAAGRPLGERFEHELVAAPADRSSPDPARWKVVPPVAADAALRVELDEPIDRGLLERAVEVRDAAGRTVDGSVTVDPGERRWLFRPSAGWSSGSFTLFVHPEIEDLAGNRPGRLFDEAARAEGARPPAEGAIERPFEVGAPPPR